MTFPTKLRNILLLLIFWRLISVYVVQTFHVPDEYWQSLEVAHRLAFGYGYLTWEWRGKIRSYIYPFLISILYRILSLFGMDYAILLTNLPRIFQALLSGYADYRFYLWTRSKWALFTMCTNWFWYYCASRTLANSLETSLTTIALSVFPWMDRRSRGTGFLLIIGFLIAARPTAAIIWAPLCLYHVRTSSRTMLDLAKTYGSIAIFTLSYSILVDFLCYKTFVLTPWEFFRTNVLDGVANFYGSHHFCWYLVSGLPVILGLPALVFPLALSGAFKNSVSCPQQALMAFVICWTIATYSCLAHKEFRFILPLLPMLISVCTDRSNYPFLFRITEFRRKILLSILLIGNLLPGFYFCLIHQRGSLDVMRLLREKLTGMDFIDKSLMFLTPCHATPMYSHLHINVTTRFLTCEPNLHNSPDYVDETDKFFEDPMIWLDTNIGNKNISIPDLLVLFDNLSIRIKPFLMNYRLIDKIFHAHFPQPNYGKYIEIYKRY